jgi:hypothetical protein
MQALLPVPERKNVLLRLTQPSTMRCPLAGDELRSNNAQIEFILRRALSEAARLPREAGRIGRTT